MERRVCWLGLIAYWALQKSRHFLRGGGLPAGPLFGGGAGLGLLGSPSALSYATLSICIASLAIGWSHLVRVQG